MSDQGSRASDTPEDIFCRMKAMGISKSDIEEKFVRSPGKGGQKVNKTSSCVYLCYIPLGITVKYHRQRSQSQNRACAWKVLLAKVEAFYAQKKAQEKKRIEKERRRGRKRSARAKELLLRNKRKASEKKKLRAYRYRNDE
ncbi:MAG: peptide chain release factor-like protein [Candidatus Omnitrophota bacterium]|jgi:protein subunit release factor B